LRILLTGRNGQVGWELGRTLPALGELLGTDRTTLDLADPGSIRRALRDAKPEIVVNAGAYTAVDKAESEGGLATQVNAVAPGVLAEETKRLGALLVHYSTDYVFDGEKRAPYAEDDAPNPLSHYARSKLEGERAIVATGCRHLILRTSWVYGPRAANFYQIIRRKAQSNEPMLMVDDQTSVPTTSGFVASRTVDLLKANAEGLLHLVPAGQATRYEFAREVVKAMKSGSTVEAVKSDRFPSAARRPAYSVMSSGSAGRLLGATFPDWRVLLERGMKVWTQA
jgi:dTDP-4-dehydrorhamnose reductase